MIFLRKITYIALAAGMLLLTACGQSRNGDAGNSSAMSISDITSLPLPKAPTLTHADSTELKYLFLEAVRRQTAEDFDGAFYILQKCLSINPAAPEVRYKLAMYWSALQNDSLAMENFELAAALNPTNSDYMERLAQYCIAKGDYSKATRVYEHLAKTDKQRNDVLTILMQLYQVSKDYDKMIDVLNQLEKIEGSNEDITFSKMRVYEMKGDKNAAWGALKELADQHPNDVSYKVMMGNWLMQNGNYAEAFQLFEQAREEEPENAFVLTSMYDYYRAAGEDSLARNLMMDILTNANAESETRTTLMRQAIKENEEQGGDSIEILDLFDKSIEANTNDIDMIELKAAYMTLKGMPEKDINAVYYKILEVAPDNIGARIQLLLTYVGASDWDKTIEICKSGTEYNPDEMAFYYYLGMSYFQKDEDKLALDAFKQGVAQVKEDSKKDLVSDFYYFIGDLEHKMGNEKAAFEAYDSCLHWKADNIPCLNNYAYYLSLTNKELDRAERMSYKTIKAEPDNATYLDTYAWILFQQKRYSEALIYVEQLLNAEDTTEQSEVILEHAGDIYYMNDNIDKAVEYWRKALEKDTGNATLKRKVKQKKYIE